MRTNIVINDELIRKAQHLTGIKTKRRDSRGFGNLDPYARTGASASPAWKTHLGWRSKPTAPGTQP